MHTTGVNPYSSLYPSSVTPFFGVSTYPPVPSSSYQEPPLQQQALPLVASSSTYLPSDENSVETEKLEMLLQHVNLIAKINFTLCEVPENVFSKLFGSTQTKEQENIKRINIIMQRASQLQDKTENKKASGLFKATSRRVSVKNSSRVVLNGFLFVNTLKHSIII